MDRNQDIPRADVFQMTLHHIMTQCLTQPPGVSTREYLVVRVLAPASGIVIQTHSAE